MKKLNKLLSKITSSFTGQLLTASLLGSIQVFAFSPFQQWWVLYPSFVGIFLLLQKIGSQNKKSFLVSFAFNLSMFIATIHWIYVSMDLFGGMPAIVSILLIVLLCAYLALFPTLALWLTYKIKTNSNAVRLLLILPSVWLITDFLRGWVLTGFPWAYLGYSHIDTPLIGFAPILGVQGVTLAILLICASLTLLFVKEAKLLSVALILSLLIAGYSLQKLNYTTLQSPIKVALVQGNIDQNEKWLREQLTPSLLKYLQLSKIEFTNKKSLSSQVSTNSDQFKNELIIWPESAIAALELNMQHFLKPLSSQLEKQGKTLLTGIIDYDKSNKSYFNSIIALGRAPEGETYSPTNLNRYSKHHLLPIGEFVPFEDLLRPLAPYFNLPMSSFHRGAEIQRNLQTNQATLAAALCYEIAFPELLRKNIHEDTGLLLTLSNDAWFGSSIGPDQHLQIARMRAIEFGRPVLRSTNTGITAIYDSAGKELGRLPAYTDAVLRREVQPAHGKTPYQRIGQLPLYLFSLISLIAAFIFIRKQNNSD